MKDDRIYLLHIRDGIEHIFNYTAAGRDSFFADRKTDRATPSLRRTLRMNRVEAIKQQTQK